MTPTTRTATKPARQPTRRGTDRTKLLDRVFLLVVGAAALAFLLPLLPLAGAAYVVLYALRTRRRVVRVGAFAACLVPAVVALLWAWRGAGIHPQEALGGYAAVQQRAIVWAARAARDGAAFPWLEYGLAVWVYAVAGGPLLGLVFGIWFGNRVKEENPNERTPFNVVGADEHARMPAQPTRVYVQQFLGARRVTVLASWPKQGKSFAVGGMLAAGRAGGEWFGRRVSRMRTFWLTEESRGGFKDTVDAFGLRSGDVAAVHAQEVRGQGWFGEENWEAQIEHACALARRRKADVLVVDSLFTWASWYQRSPDAASFCFRTLRTAAERHGLAVLAIAHNTKAGDPDAPVLALLGTIAASAMVDQVASFRRDKDTGHCTLKVEGRRLNGEEGEWECTAQLHNGNYVPIGSPLPPPATRPPHGMPDIAPPKPLPRVLAQTMASLRQGPKTAGELQEALSISKPTASERLSRLLRLGLVEKVKGEGRAQTWRVRSKESE